MAVDFEGHKIITVANYKAFRQSLIDDGTWSDVWPENFDKLPDAMRRAFLRGADAVFNQVYAVPVGMDAQSMALMKDELEDEDAREEAEERRL